MDSDLATNHVVTSLVDAATLFFAGALKVTIDKLQRAFLWRRTWVGLYCSAQKFARRGLSHLMHSDLHWLDVPERVMVFSCVHSHPIRT